MLVPSIWKVRVRIPHPTASIRTGITLEVAPHAHMYHAAIGFHVRGGRMRFETHFLEETHVLDFHSGLNAELLSRVETNSIAASS